MSKFIETRGRKPNPVPSVKRSLAIPGHIYQSLLDEQKLILEKTGTKPKISDIAFQRMRTKRSKSKSVQNEEKIPSVKVNWCIPGDVWKILKDEQKSIKKLTNVEPNITKVIYSRLEA